MAEEVYLSLDKTYILVRSTGSPSLDEMKKTLSRIIELNNKHKVNKVLVDGRDRNEQPPMLDIYSGGELLSNMMGGGIRISILVAEITDNHHFFETVALNRGADVAYFQEEDSALKWLLLEGF